MSETTAYLPVSYGAKTCAFAAAAVKTSPADMTHPVNSFIAQSLLQRPTARSFSLLVPPANLVAESGGPWSVLGPDRGAFASNPGQRGQPCRRGGCAIHPATFARLYDRKKFGMVGVRTAKLSHLRCEPGTGIATKVRRFGRREGADKAVRRGR